MLVPIGDTTATCFSASTGRGRIFGPPGAGYPGWARPLGRSRIGPKRRACWVDLGEEPQRCPCLSFPDLVTEVPIPFERGPLTAPSLIAMSPEKSAPICGRPAPSCSYPLIGGTSITPARPMTFGVASLTRDMRIPMSRGPFTGHIREERRSCTTTRASHRRPGLLPRTGARPGLAPGGRRPIPPRPGRDSQPNHPQARGSRCQLHLHLRRGARLAAGVPTVRARRRDLVPAGDSRATSPILRVRLVHSLSYARVSSASPCARSGALVGDARREAGRSLAGHHGRTAVLGPNAARNDCGVQRDSLVIRCTRPLDVVGDCVNRR